MMTLLLLRVSTTQSANCTVRFCFSVLFWTFLTFNPDLIGQIGQVNRKLQVQILNICENWILQERVNFAALVPQTITALLSNVLEDPKVAGTT